MNLKIQKFEGGGSSSFTVYQPLGFATALPESEKDSDVDKLTKAITKSAGKSGKESNTGKITDKDMLGILKDMQVLPSDMLDLYKEVMKFYNTPKLPKALAGINGDEDDSLDYSKFSRLTMDVAFKAKVAKFNYEVWDKARTQMYAHNATDEIALTTKGEVIIQKADGGLTTIGVNQWVQNPGKYKTLTNNDVLRLREEKFSNSNNLLTIVEGSASIDTVTQKINNVLKLAGTDAHDGIFNPGETPTEVLANIGKELAQAGVDPRQVTLDGIYKYTSKSNARKLQYLAGYAWNQLSYKERALLTAHSGKPNGGMSVMIPLLVGGQISQSMDLQYSKPSKETDGTSKSSKGSNGSDDWRDSADATQAFQIQVGLGGSDSNFEFRGTKSNYAYHMPAKRYGALTDKNGNVIETTSVADMLAKSGIQPISDTRSVYFGDVPVKAENLKDIVYLNEGAQRAVVPCKIDKYGNKVPNMEVMSKFEAAYKEIQKIKYKEGTKEFEAAYGAILKSKGLDDYVLSNGYPNKEKFGVFLIVNGETSEAVLGKDAEPKMVQRIKGDYDELSNILYPDGKGGSTKKLAGNGTLWDDDLYRAPVFIPITTNNPLASINMKVHDAYNIEGLHQGSKQPPIGDTSSNILNN